MMPTPHRLIRPCVNKSTQKTLHRVLSTSVAKAVVAERKKNGLFKSWEDLQKRVDCIGEKELTKLQAEAVLDSASTSPSKPAKDPSPSNPDAPSRRNKKRKNASTSSKRSAAKPSSTADQHDNISASQINELKESPETMPAAPPLQVPQYDDSDDEDAPEDYKKAKANWLKRCGNLDGFGRPKHVKSYDEIMRDVGEALMHPQPVDPRCKWEGAVFSAEGKRANMGRTRPFRDREETISGHVFSYIRDSIEKRGELQPPAFHVQGDTDMQHADSHLGVIALEDPINKSNYNVLTGLIVGQDANSLFVLTCAHGAKHRLDDAATGSQSAMADSYSSDLVGALWTNKLLEGKGRVCIETAQGKVYKSNPHPALAACVNNLVKRDLVSYFFPLRTFEYDGKPSREQEVFIGQGIHVDPGYSRLFTAKPGQDLHRHAYIMPVLTCSADSDPLMESGHDIAVFVFEKPQRMQADVPGISYCLATEPFDEQTAIGRYCVNIMGFPSTGNGQPDIVSTITNPAQHAHMTGAAATRVQREVYDCRMQSSSGNLSTVTRSASDSNAFTVAYDAFTGHGQSGAPVFLAQHQDSVSSSCLLPFFCTQSGQRIIFGVHSGKTDERRANRFQGFGSSAIKFIKSIVHDIDHISLKELEDKEKLYVETQDDSALTSSGIAVVQFRYRTGKDTHPLGKGDSPEYGPVNIPRHKVRKADQLQLRSYVIESHAHKKKVPAQEEPVEEPPSLSIGQSVCDTPDVDGLQDTIRPVIATAKPAWWSWCTVL